MTVFLVRHGNAGSRHDWRQPDELRPLSEKGASEAEGLVAVLGNEATQRVVSSPSMRCRLTVQPLADKLGLEVELDARLLEGAPLKDVLAALRDLAAGTGDVVACSHGDLIPDVLRHLAARGMQIEDRLTWPKGSTWALEWDGQRFARGRYLPPATR